MNNCGESHLFGLEPEYGCCTANFNQGWPKFALSTFMRAPDGIAVGAIAPSILRTTQNGIPVIVENITDYPFRDEYTIRINTDRPVTFTLHLRIPSFAKSATVNGEQIEVTSDGWILIRRNWRDQQTISIAFEFEPVLSSINEGLYSVRRGPLLYALPIGERWERLEYTKKGVERKYPYCDYEIFPTTQWNYGFARDSFRFETYPIGEMPFNPTTPPVGLYADMVEIEWPYESGHCTRLPAGQKALSPVTSQRLIPYGCTNLRMTEIPLIQIEEQTGKGVS